MCETLADRLWNATKRTAIKRTQNYSFVHFSLLNNDSCHSWINRLLLTEAPDIWIAHTHQGEKPVMLQSKHQLPTYQDGRQQLTLGVMGGTTQLLWPFINLPQSWFVICLKALYGRKLIQLMQTLWDKTKHKQVQSETSHQKRGSAAVSHPRARSS